MSKKEVVTKEDLIKILDFLDSLNITYWLDGGWGVDVLFGRQTREHRDIDIDFDAKYTDKLLDELLNYGYKVCTDCQPVRIELHHTQTGYIDIHPFILLGGGKAKQADGKGGFYEFEADFFSSAVFERRNIPCISLKGQQIFHTGYELREVDKHDIKNIEQLLKK